MGHRIDAVSHVATVLLFKMSQKCFFMSPFAMQF